MNEPGFQGDHVSVTDAPREIFDRHPWAIGGGGAAELKEAIEEACHSNIASVPCDLGVLGITAADDVLMAPAQSFSRRGVDSSVLRYLLTGDCVREWTATPTTQVIFPGESPPDGSSGLGRWLWPCRTLLGNRATFSQGTYFSEGRPWWQWHQLTPQRLATALSLVYGEIATHNHFVLDRGGRVFNQTAPIIKMPANATETQYLQLLAVLNSSTACFWIKQVCHSKGTRGVGGGLCTEAWEQFVCINTGTLSRYPLPPQWPGEIARAIQYESDARFAMLPEQCCATGVPTRESLNSARVGAEAHFARMIALQEEIDWFCYQIYGIVEDDLTARPEEIPPLALGERAFEICMAREGRGSTWFERHQSKPITELPAHWPEAYRKVVRNRLEALQSNRDIRLIEHPEYKRRWNLPTWEEMEKSALKNWLLDRMEASAIWREDSPISCAKLRDALARDTDWISVAEVANGGPIEDLDELIVRLAVTESVPFLPVLRYNEAGQRKRAEWEEVWKLQRHEDAGEKIEIPVPARYRSSDFLKNDYWRLRGGLDVPKERSILYPGFERDADASPVLGWAGWSHLEQARALAGYYQRMRNEEGWEPERLKPILAGLLDLKPWLLHWHNEINPEMGVREGEYFVQFAEGQCHELGFSTEDVRACRPVAASYGRRGSRRRSR